MLHSSNGTLELWRATNKLFSEIGRVFAHTAEHILNVDALAIQDSLLKQANTIKRIEPTEYMHRVMTIQKNLSQELIEIATNYWFDSISNKLENQLNYVWCAQNSFMQRVDDVGQKLEANLVGSVMYLPSIKFTINAVRLNIAAAIQVNEEVGSLITEQNKSLTHQKALRFA